ncbi:MAG: hypothetical protein ACJAQ7_000240 [Sediminicola sp.]|jgi:hypothetical protein
MAAIILHSDSLMGFGSGLWGKEEEDTWVYAPTKTSPIDYFS